MPNAIFTYSPNSRYDDQPELRYHFPKTYLRVAEEAVGDWILYCELRRTTGASSSSGRQSYFAMARVTRIVPDDQQGVIDSLLSGGIPSIPRRAAGPAVPRQRSDFRSQRC
jgi:hypothetical protein